MLMCVLWGIITDIVQMNHTQTHPLPVGKGKNMSHTAVGERLKGQEVQRTRPFLALFSLSFWQPLTNVFFVLPLLFLLIQQRLHTVSSRYKMGPFH